MSIDTAAWICAIATAIVFISVVIYAAKRALTKNVNYHFCVVKYLGLRRPLNLFKLRFFIKPTIEMRMKKSYFGGNEKLNLELFLSNLDNLLFALTPNKDYYIKTHDIIIKRISKSSRVQLIETSQNDRKPKYIDISKEKAMINGNSLLLAILKHWVCKRSNDNVVQHSAVVRRTR